MQKVEGSSPFSRFAKSLANREACFWFLTTGTGQMPECWSWKMP